jgi:predicted membrane protein
MNLKFKKMKRISIVMMALLVTTLAYAQEYKVAKSTGRLNLHIGRVTVEGHSGNEIIFTTKDGRDKDEDDRAKGLRPINNLGMEDNTGLGINVTEKDGNVEVYQLKKMNSPDIKILVPKGVIVSFDHTSQYGGEAVFRNMENEIEVSCQYNSVELENVTGPLTVKAVYGGVDATFSQNVKGPISIVSIYGHVDVALPAATKANLKMSTSYGEIFMAPEFKITVEGDERDRDGDRVKGTINGGGMNIDFRSDYGKIYLRKK